MDGQTDTTVEDQNSNASADPWAEAFAALDNLNENGAKGDTNRNEQLEDNDAKDVNGSTGSNVPASEDSNEDEDDVGGPSDISGGDREEDDAFDNDLFRITEEEVEEYRNGIIESIRDRAVGDMAREFIKRGIRHQNGKLGASLNDPDICKRDEDGVPRFYNPDTGNEFTGDNPRRQAQEWCEDYNKELAEAFNTACDGYTQKLMEDEEPQIKVLEFASKYDDLDPIRREMFDMIIEDYEISNDDGNVIGYSCDLDRALNAVNRQIEKIQAYARTNVSKPKEESSGPVMDMKNSAGAAAKPGDKPKFNSLAEAMEYEQDKLLENIRKGN